MRLYLFAFIVVSTNFPASAQQVGPQRDELDQALGRGIGTGGGNRGIPPLINPQVPNPNMDPRSPRTRTTPDPKRAGIDYGRSFGTSGGSRIQPILQGRQMFPNGYDILPNGTVLYRSDPTSQPIEPVRPDFTDEQMVNIYQEWLDRSDKATASAEKVAPARRAKVLASATSNIRLDLAKKHKLTRQNLYWILAHGPELKEEPQPAAPSDEPAAPSMMMAGPMQMGRPRKIDSDEPAAPSMMMAGAKPNTGRFPVAPEKLPVASKTEAQHRAIFKDWATQRNAALKQAESMPSAQKVAYIRQVDLKLVRDLTLKYRITHPELDSIENYGAKHNWW